MAVYLKDLKDNIESYIEETIDKYLKYLSEIVDISMENYDTSYVGDLLYKNSSYENDGDYLLSLSYSKYLKVSGKIVEMDFSIDDDSLDFRYSEYFDNDKNDINEILIESKKNNDNVIMYINKMEHGICDENSLDYIDFKINENYSLLKGFDNVKVKNKTIVKNSLK